MDELLPNFAGAAEASLTLEEALELIDNCDIVPSLDDVGCIPPDLSTSNELEASSASTKPKKRVWNPLHDVKRRQRRKSERQQLKEQVHQLEALVGRLKHSRQTQSSVESRALTLQEADSAWLYTMVKRSRSDAELKKAMLNSELWWLGDCRRLERSVTCW